MGYWEEEAKKRRRKISESAANIFMVFCGFFGVYLLAAHMLYQDISAWSMLPYLIGGVVAAFLLRWIAGMAAPEALGRRKISDGEENGKRKTDAGRTGVGRNDAEAVGAAPTGTDAKKRNRKKKNRSAAKNDVHQRTVYDRENAVRRWQALLTLAVCLVFFLWNFKYILRGSLVLADNIVFYFNYVFGTSCKFSVDLFSGRYVTVLGSGNALYHLSDANIGAVTLVKSLGANSKVLFGTIAFYSALLKTEYGCGKKTVLADVLFGGALLAAAFLVGAYEMSWTSLCLLLYLVSLLITFTQGGESSEKERGKQKKYRTRRRESRTEKKGNRTEKKEGRAEQRKHRTEEQGYPSESGKEKQFGKRKAKREKEKNIRGGKTHILTVHNAKTASFAAVLMIIVSAVLSVSIFLVRQNSYFDDYDTPWIVEKWEQAGDFINGLRGGSGGSTAGTSAGEQTDLSDPETESGEEETSDGGESETTIVSWEPAQDGENGTADGADAPSMDLELGTLTLEDEMREGSDTAYLRVLIDASYFNTTNRLYLKCYTGEVYEGDSWTALTAEDFEVTEDVYNAVNAALAVSTYDLFNQCLQGTASSYLSRKLPGLFDIHGSGQIRIQYLGDSSVQFVPYYALPTLESDADVTDFTTFMVSGDGSTIYIYNMDELLPEVSGAAAGDILEYTAAAVEFGDAFAYGNDLAEEESELFAGYEEEYLTDENYLYIPESMTRFREEFSTVEIDGVTYETGLADSTYGTTSGGESADGTGSGENLNGTGDDETADGTGSGENLNETVDSESTGETDSGARSYVTWTGERIVDQAGLGDCVGWVINYLTNNMTYSRSVTAVAEGEDYIEAFLFDRESGYCSHYASAAVMMFRMLGIPARYAEGFAVDYDDAVLTTGGQYLVNVTGKSAHAWVEIYVTGVGWVAVNVTYGGNTAGEEGEETTLPGETTGEGETTVPQTTAAAQTEEESMAADGTGSREAEQATGDSVFAKLSGALQSIAEFFIKLIRVLKLPIVLLLLFELLRLVVRFARSLLLKWKCRGRSEEEKILIYAADLNRYIDRHLHIKKRRTMAQSEVAEAEGDLFARADGKAGGAEAADGRQTGWHPFRYHVQGREAAKPGRGRRRGPADLIVRMGARDGEALTAAEYEELLGLIRYAGMKTDTGEQANLYLTMRKVKLVIYKESPWRRKVFF